MEPDPQDEVDGRRRYYYRLTPEGRQSLAAEVHRLRANVAVAVTRFGLADTIP